MENTIQILKYASFYIKIAYNYGERCLIIRPQADQTAVIFYVNYKIKLNLCTYV